MLTMRLRATATLKARVGVRIAVLLCAILGLSLTASPAMAAPAQSENNPCYATAIHGALQLDMNQEVNIGGPNFTSGVCRDINIKLTEAQYRTYARACLEPSDGGPLNCPTGEKDPTDPAEKDGFQLLQYDLQFEVLRPNVLGNTRWQLQMYSTSAETVTFDYTA